MYNENIKNRIFNKLDAALKIYEKMIFEKVGMLSDTEAYFTKEHLRAEPDVGFEPIAPGTQWGEEWDNMWLRGDFTVPSELDGKALYAVSDCGGKEELFFLNGIPKGLINSKNRDFVGGNHTSRYLGKAKAGEKIHLAFECYAGHYDPNTDPYDDYFRPDPTQGFCHTFGGVEICTRNDDVFTLIFDIRELLNAARRLSESNFASARAQNTLLRINDKLILFPKDASREEVMKSVRECLEISREFFSGGNSRVFGKVGIIGHSHMDTAWLWPVSETIRKCARTYSNALDLMDQYPSYNFIQSSALHSEWMKDYYPDIFAEMKKRVAQGRYEPNGGVYVECDCNITSGELMARQFLKGQQFTRENFDYTADSFWLPDTFGYNANIPQIMRLSNIKYFYTTKISWNELNTFPFMSFVWKGIDGSEVITHFNRTHCWPDVNDCAACVRDIPQKDSVDMRLLAYGYGDGGGGPTPGQIESSLRSSDMEGMPVIEPMTISEFGKELEERKDELPVYHDELYLELHRGTLTQMHDVKRKNRKAEYALRDMEFFNVVSGRERNENSDRWLKILLKNQFHDILPGTCIKPVYDVYNKEMDEIISAYKETAGGYASSLAQPADSTVTLYNTLSFERGDAAEIEAPGYAKDYPSQRFTDVCGREKLAVGGVKIPAFSGVTVELSPEPVSAQSPFTYDGKVLVTPYAKITFDENGYISSLVDTASGRELRKKGGAPLNVFLFGEDIPLYYDNWDIDRDVVKNLAPVYGFEGRELVTDGAVEIRLRSKFRIDEKTSLVQDMVCYADSPRIDFHTLIDWNSPHRLLKAGFDLDISASRARSEIQFGCIERPTTVNNSLELAKFEVCNRNYTDISETRFGAAILNDCKYGITVTDCNLRLSLHRGGTHPDYTGDSGKHEMTYSLLPHSGAFSAENTVRPAYELNIPAFCIKGRAQSEPFASIGAPNIIAESVKPAEDGSDSFVMRLYECEGAKTEATVKVNVPFSGAALTNILEDTIETIPSAGGEITLNFRPFEIKTVKFTR
ncbi:MAG: alpha-mannosidase [Clostridia bacterium]|nr:alpha-mannosidase [Clostridia bacterium]